MYDFNHKLLFPILCVTNLYNHILMGHVISKRWGDNTTKVVNFRCVYFIYMTYMTDEKMIWMSKLILQWWKVDYNGFDMNIDKVIPHLPTYLPIYLPTNPPTTYLLTHQPTHLFTFPPTHSFSYPLTHLPTFYNLPTYLPTNLPISYFISPTTYLPPAYHLTTCLLPTS
jgi:hypothetical protein